MTVQDNAKIVYPMRKEQLEEAKKEQTMAASIAEEIYRSREGSPNESQLIRNFYYSIYHLIKGISVVDTGCEYKSHHALISYFNRESKKEGFLQGIVWNVEISDSIRSGIDRLFVLRDEYEYREENVVEEDYLEAEKIWLEIFPELDNLLAKMIEV